MNVVADGTARGVLAVVKVPQSIFVIGYPVQNRFT